MQLDLEDVITNPEWIGKIVYVCAYQPGRYTRALQNIKATPCVIVTRDDYYEQSTQKKDVYYCTNILIAVNERHGNKRNYNRPISPYDNTSFKSRKNGPICVFDNLVECQNHYISLMKTK